MPERSTVPDSGYFYDYSLIFAMLERAIPSDWQILYKEHPRSFRKPIAAENPRDVDFLLRIREACPRLIFVDQQTDSKKLIKEAKIVATASGTSGWESVARGVPALLFGERWYGSCKGIHCIYSLADLKQAVAVIKQNPTVPPEDVVDFLKRVESVSEDMAYYYKDNIEERSRYSGTIDTRSFTPEELEYRKMFIQKMAEFFSSNIERIRAA
jgi:hypothetical protein